jgi:hypothetical protein
MQVIKRNWTSLGESRFRVKGKPDAALVPYRWVKEHGTAGLLAHRLAVGELDPLEQKEKTGAKK